MASPGTQPRGMTPERWAAIGDLFEQALGQPARDRDEWLQKAAGDDTILLEEVRSLLASHNEAGGFIQDQLREAVVSFHERSGRPERVGPYRLVSELGRGGMGTVYLAERDDEEYHSRVAIKLVRPGMDTEFVLQRFRLERQTLARLRHPNIARLLDGGTTESGLPYIVMEYVDGPRITEFAKERRLTLAERISLFLPVCAAVDYAHRQFVVHRDLKPGNILVDGDGVPKLLDFGIAKLLLTEPLAAEETAAVMLTPDYASPEQVRGEAITVASDVYSLAAVLYEMLTGVRPHRFSKLTPLAIERTVCEEDVAPPSYVAANRADAPRLEGDLDNILMRALDKNPTRRYESAAALADDLRRHLDHKPVRARANTLSYRALKFARRNRGYVLAGALITLSMAAGTWMSMRQARIAQYRLNQVRGLANKFVFDVHDAVRDLPGSTAARKLIVATGLEYLNALSADTKDPEFRVELARAYTRIGDVQGGIRGANLGDTPAALTSFGRARSLLAGLEGTPAAIERLAVAHRIGDIQASEQHSKDAAATYLEALKQAAPLLNAVSVEPSLQAEAGNVYVDLSAAVRNMGRYEESMEHSRQAVTLTEAAIQKSGRTAELRGQLASAYAALGMSEARLSQFKPALTHFQECSRLRQEMLDATPTNRSNRREMMLALGHVADVLGNPNMPNLGDREGALAVFRKAADLGRGLYEDDPADQRAVSDYGIVLSRVTTVLPDTDPTKLATIRQALEVFEGAMKASPANTNHKLYAGVLHEQAGILLAAKGDRAGAEREFGRGIEQCEDVLKRGQTSGLILYLSMSRRQAELLARDGKAAQALEIADKALRLGETPPPGINPRMVLPRAYAVVAYTHLALHHRDAAREWLGKTIDAWKKVKSDPAFAAPHQREMREAEQAMAKMMSGSNPQIRPRE